MPNGKKVWILAPPQAGLMNVAGAFEVFSHANDVLGQRAYEISLHGPVVPEITTGHGLVISGIRSLPTRFQSAPHLIIVAGGSAFGPVREGDRILASWLRKHAREFKSIVSICAGAFTLGEAGLLDGRRVTTHWMALDRLAAQFPKAHVVDEGIFVRDGNIWTSAGITAGIDLCLALVERDFGHRIGMEVAQRLVLFLRRSGNQAQFSAALKRQTNEPSRLDQLSNFLLEHLSGDLRVPFIAEAMGMSPRTLSRWCQEHLRESPAEMVRRLRIEEAARKLSETTLPLKQVAAQTGLGDPSTLWRAFVKYYGVTPDEYRARFSSTLDGLRKGRETPAAPTSSPRRAAR